MQDDPICVAARSDGKTLVTALWVYHSFDVGMPVDPALVSIYFVPVYPFSDCIFWLLLKLHLIVIQDPIFFQLLLITVEYYVAQVTFQGLRGTVTKPAHSFGSTTANLTNMYNPNCLLSFNYHKKM